MDREIWTCHRKGPSAPGATGAGPQGRELGSAVSVHHGFWGQGVPPDWICLRAACCWARVGEAWSLVAAAVVVVAVMVVVVVF